MHQRCSDPNHKHYIDYGGRGIKVCARWAEFTAFLEDMGERPKGKSIDRKDNNGDYEPGNCQWASKYEQANNRRSSKFLEFSGERLTQAQWEERMGLRRGQLYDRLHRGWSLERALQTPRTG